jgi:hypothetical protein
LKLILEIIKIVGLNLFEKPKHHKDFIVVERVERFRCGIKQAKTYLKRRFCAKKRVADQKYSRHFHVKKGQFCVNTRVVRQNSQY